MQKFILNTSAFSLECVSVFLAAPAAASAFGTVPGYALSAAIGLAIFFSWFNAFNGKKGTLKTAGLVVLASALLCLSSFAINTAKNADSISNSENKRTEKAEQAEFNYQAALDNRAEQIRRNSEIHAAQEKARIDSLNQINREIKATAKAKQPEIYASLLDRQSELSVATIKSPDPIMPTRQMIVDTSKTTQLDYLAIAQSGAYGFLVPILLLLAAMSPQSNKTLTARILNGTTRKFNRTEQVCSSTNSASANERDRDPFLCRLIPTGDSGEVRMEDIQCYFNCGIRPAQRLRKEAVELGYLENRSNRYYYSSRHIQPQAGNIVQLRAAQ